MEQEQGNIIQLLDENNQAVSFDLLMTFDYEGKRYAALLPMDKVENVGDDEVVLLEIVKESGEEAYISIDNPVLLNEVFDVFMELFDEMLDEEDDLDERADGETAPER